MGGLLRYFLVIVFCVYGVMSSAVALEVDFQQWKDEWAHTDFSNSLVDLNEIMSGGPPKDGIPAIDKPTFTSARSAKGIHKKEPVMSVHINGDARAYPITILMFHEIVNDTVGGVPVAITYCPLCNASIVFDRRIKDRILDFGTTGKLRHSDMVMYDRQTESWWQQFVGKAIVGELAGQELAMVPSKVESFQQFQLTHPDGKVLSMETGFFRRYGNNPYVRYDSAKWPFLFKGKYDGPVPPLAYVVMIGKEAWPLELVREKRRIEHKDIEISWKRGMSSALDTLRIAEGRDIGMVEVKKKGVVVPHAVPFAFAFKIFHPEGVIYVE